MVCPGHSLLILFFHCPELWIPASWPFAVPLLMIHMTLRKKTLWFLGALSFFASLAATFAVFWLNRNDSSPAEWNFNPIWTKAEKEQILTVANFTAHRSPERFIYRGLSLNSRHIDWHMFSEVSMRQYMKDEIRERLQMIRDTAESADGRCITPSHETLLHLAAGLGEVQLLNRLLQFHFLWQMVHLNYLQINLWIG